MLANTIPRHLRGPSLRKILKKQDFCRLIEVHSPLSAIVAEHARDTETGEREFQGFWSSSLADSALRGLPDIELLPPQTRIEWIRHILNSTTKPLLMDGDTGGRPEIFANVVRAMENEGISGVVIEDKKGHKQNSLLSRQNIHTLEDTEAFCQKITEGKDAQFGDEFMIVARLEGLITGLSVNEVADRGLAYSNAGADALVVHSRSKDAQQVLTLAQQLREAGCEKPLVAIPTAYPHISEQTLRDSGFNVAIYANHMIRASLKSMSTAASVILTNQRAFGTEEICVETSTLLALSEGNLPLETQETIGMTYEPTA